MKKRDFLKAGGLAGVAFGLSSQGMAMENKAPCQQETGFLFVHGAWHGAWAWHLVMQHLQAAGYRAFAIDLPGHGLDAILPDSFTTRPLDKRLLRVSHHPWQAIASQIMRRRCLRAQDRHRRQGLKG